MTDKSNTGIDDDFGWYSSYTEGVSVGLKMAIVLLMDDSVKQEDQITTLEKMAEEQVKISDSYKRAKK